jgi:flagellar hook-associated protein 1 FlgK
MSGLFSTLNISKRGLSVQQKSIDVSGHNIANANTEGYSRQRAKIETTTPEGMPSFTAISEPGQLGTGAQIAAIERIRDSFLDYQIRKENSTYGNYDKREQFLSEVQSIYNEPTDAGISKLMDKFFAAWQEGSKSPNSTTAKNAIVEQAKGLAQELNHTSTQLTKLSENTSSLIKNDVTTVNSILSQVNSLNKQIKSVKVMGNEPNDLMDKRDLLIDQLSLKMDIETKDTSYGGVNITSGGINLINADDTDSYSQFVYEARSSSDSTLVLKEEKAVKGSDGKYTVPSSATKKEYTPKNGEFAGLLSVKDDAQKYMTELDNLAKTIAFSVNSLYSVNYDASGNATATEGTLFFVKDGTTSDTGVTAANIAINSDLESDSSKLNANKSNDSSKKDGLRALAIAQLKNTVFNVSTGTSGSLNSRSDFATKNGLNKADLTFTGDKTGSTVTDYFTSSIGSIGTDVSEATRIKKNQTTLLSSFEETKTSTSGVSLDEEMANIVQFQHAYTANAKMISLVDELLDVVIGLKR